jgi:hypothetical protein
MLVDRNLILDLIALEPKRENGYRHPHCIIVNNSESIQEEQEKAKNCMKNTHAQAFKLIEESFNSNSWFVLFLCVLMLCSFMFASCHTFASICCVCVFMVELKSEREMD